MRAAAPGAMASELSALSPKFQAVAKRGAGTFRPWPIPRFPLTICPGIMNLPRRAIRRSTPFDGAGRERDTAHRLWSIADARENMEDRVGSQGGKTRGTIG